MARHPLRRSQLVRPFGVGSMSTFPDGVSLMVAGLDPHGKGGSPGSQLSEGLDEGREIQRFRENGAPGAVPEMGELGHVGVSRHHDGAGEKPGVVLLQAIHEPVPAPLRHLQVGDQEVGFPVGEEFGEGTPTTPRLPNLITEALQHPAQAVSNRLLIVHQEHRSVHPEGEGDGVEEGEFSPGSRGKFQENARPLPPRSFDDAPAPMKLRHASSQGEPQPEPPRASSEEGFEGAIAGTGIHPGPRIPDPEADPSSRHPLSLQRNLSGPATLLHRIECVLKEMGQRPRQEPRVPHHRFGGELRGKAEGGGRCPRVLGEKVYGIRGQALHLDPHRIRLGT